MGYDKTSRAALVAQDPQAVAVIEKFAPRAMASPILGALGTIRLEQVVGGPLFAAAKPAQLDALWEELAALPGSAPEPAPQPRPTAQAPSADHAAPATALLSAPVSARVRERVEIEILGPSTGNPFVDVDVVAELRKADRTVRVGGFYDGDGVYRIRWMPDESGAWELVTTSNVPSMHGLHARIEVGAATEGARGPVRVADGFHFAHEDGTRHHPLGTTLYAWWHQSEELRARTLAQLESAPFTKARVCVFPKSYLFNLEEPEVFPYVREEDGSFDLSRFDLGFFRRLEESIEQLAERGVQTDLILFHAYDRWGFSEMPEWADDLYVQYAVRRLSAHESVWWSLANEYDLLPGKTAEDWERFAHVVNEEDHVGHLLSIHNCFAPYDQSRPWITHVSMQRVDVYRTAEDTTAWREQWGKPVVIDECGYEGDIDLGWGNLAATELVRRAWEAAVRGGYLNHGETYVNDAGELWWSKGGELVGESPARFAFLRRLLEEVPGGVLDPVASDWDVPWGSGGGVTFVYFGFGQPRYREIVRPPGVQYVVDVIDTWEMSVERLPGTYEGAFRVELPGRQWMALRLTALS